MNMINILIAKAAKSSTFVNNLTLKPGSYHVFDQSGEYKDYLDLHNAHQDYVSGLLNKFKRCIIVKGYGHKDEWRLSWAYITADGKVSYGTELDECGLSWSQLINPKNRKPWYWDRKLTALKAELPNWETDVQEACNMRIACHEILRELETNFNINNNYYRIQANSAEEAHSIICGCDMLIDNFEANLAHIDYVLHQREMTNWTDERTDLQL